MAGEFTSATFYDHVRVPTANLVGTENGGWAIMTNQLNLERVAISPASGILRSIEEVRAWAAAERLADGRRVIDQEWVQIALARLWARAEALKLFNWKVAWAADKGLRPADASATKVYGTEFALEAYRSLSEIVGQQAYLVEGARGSVLRGRLEREARAQTIFTFGGGTNEIQRDLIAWLGLGLPRSAPLGTDPSPARSLRQPWMNRGGRGGARATARPHVGSPQLQSARMDLQFASVWEAVADLVPDRDAIVQGDRRMTYRQFDEAAARFASAPRGRRASEADGKVALYLYNCPEYLVAQHGAFKCSAVAVNVNYRYLDDELAYILDNSRRRGAGLPRLARRSRRPGPRRAAEGAAAGRGRRRRGAAFDGAVGFEDAVAGARSPAAHRARPARTVYMLYTGGTTGMPKGVMYAPTRTSCAGSSTAQFAAMGVTRAGGRSSEHRTGHRADRPARARASRPVLPADARHRHVSAPCAPWSPAAPSCCSRAAPSTPRSCWTAVRARTGHRASSIVGDAFARPMLRALRTPSAGSPYDDLERRG